jgi:hypothetical protein
MPPKALCALLTTLLLSCGTPYPVSTPTDPCAVPAWPVMPVLNVGVIDESVCMPGDDAADLAEYLHRVNEVKLALRGCSLVVFE